MSETKNTGKLGFGLMRLPLMEDNQDLYDMEQFKTMVDHFMAAGMTYFDTAYVYDDGDSEKATKMALVDRYPRESFTLATKMNAWLGNPTAEQVKKQFEISLERTGAGYFDYYLVHAVQDNNYDIYEKYGIFDYVRGLKAEGKIRNWGFSFHAGPELLEKLLKRYPDVDFVQLQINYADWEDPSVQSRANYEMVRKYNKPFVVMEPCKGGSLATPPASVADVFKEADPDVSYASWAIRFAASLDGCLTVLSGMSSTEQMDDNLSYMTDFKPLSEAELEVVKKAHDALKAIELIPCTGCRYCMDGCPVAMQIPVIFKAVNYELTGDHRRAVREFNAAVSDGVHPSECISCGQCEGACPQRLPIISLLDKAAGML